MSKTLLKHEVKTRIDAAMLARLREDAERNERSEAWVIRRALRLYFGENGKEET